MGPRRRLRAGAHRVVRTVGSLKTLAKRRHPIPPPELRSRVHGSEDAESFIAVGEQCASDLTAALSSVGVDLRKGRHDVLDWGCGSGRVLSNFVGRRNLRLFGSDIDPDAIAWARANFPGVEFAVNERHPPLVWPDKSFDVIYGVSVLTHLDEPDQFAWLQELKRVSRPGATLALSIHGPAAVPLSDRQLAELDRTGFIFVSGDLWTGIFPEWYQTSVQTAEHVRTRFADYFQVLSVIEKGLNGHQDIALLRA